MKKPNKADLMIYKAFKTALLENQLNLYLDSAKLNRPNSPVYNPWENLLPLLIPIMIGLILILTTGMFFGLFFIIGMVLVYTHYFRKYIDKKLLERTKEYVKIDFEHCQELWSFGGLVLATSKNKKIGCIAPEGDWKEFVVQNFADFMIDKKTEENSNEQPAA